MSRALDTNNDYPIDSPQVYFDVSIDGYPAGKT
jgi:hypothetical protein